MSSSESEDELPIQSAPRAGYAEEEAEPQARIRKACQCPVCLQLLALPVVWPCGHAFCHSCSLFVCRDHTNGETGTVSCPTCRAESKTRKIRPLLPGRVFVDLLVHTFGQPECSARNTEVAAALKTIEVCYYSIVLFSSIAEPFLYVSTALYPSAKPNHSCMFY
jgi:hypothetical protein